MFGLSLVMPRVGGITSLSIARTTFITLAIALADSLWPRVGFTLPINNGLVSLYSAKTLPRPATSSGSPTCHLFVNVAM
jgi:hypothetical protein